MTANLLDFDLEGLAAFCERLGEKRFRAVQLFRWIHQKGVARFEDMTDLARSLRDKLPGVCEVRGLPVLSQQDSADGTIKWLFDVGDGNAVESVFIPEDDRGTLCVSSQAGCAVGCRFCSTGHQGFSRNLSTGEIVAQLWFAEHYLRRKFNTQERVISNVVMMGMGEPLLNLNNVVPAMELMLEDYGFGLSKRRVTLSTSGVVPALDLLKDKIDVALAISLHAPNNELRDQLVPVNKKYPMEEFLASAKRYVQDSRANDKVTVEYVMLEGINDSMEQAHELAKALKDTPSKINLIPFNPYPGSPYKRSSNSRIDRFNKVLQEHGFTVMVRKTRGDDIDAACGQLVGDVIDRTKRLAKKQMKGEAISVKIV